MNTRYDDIIRLPHHVSSARKQMSMLDRAAQFSPFAALTGYDASIAEAGRLTDQQPELAEDGAAMVDKKLRVLADHLRGKPVIQVTFFQPDRRKAGGAYVTVEGRAKKLDTLARTLLLEDGTTVGFGQILDLDGEIYRQVPEDGTFE